MRLEEIAWRETSSFYSSTNVILVITWTYAMGGSCGNYGREEKFLQVLRENLTEREYPGELGENGILIIRRKSKK